MTATSSSLAAAASATRAAVAAATSIVLSNNIKYTYQLGRSLYVPLTSKCNTIPLPVTRGPKFVLDERVVNALINVRRRDPYYNYDYLVDNESDELKKTTKNKYISTVDATVDKGNFDGVEASTTAVTTRGNPSWVCLPEYDLPLVTTLYQPSTTITAATSDYINKNNNKMKEETNDSLHPSIATLIEEVSSHLNLDSTCFEVCIAGEGEVRALFCFILLFTICCISFAVVSP